MKRCGNGQASSFLPEQRHCRATQGRGLAGRPLHAGNESALGRGFRDTALPGPPIVSPEPHPAPNREPPGMGPAQIQSWPSRNCISPGGQCPKGKVPPGPDWQGELPTHCPAQGPLCWGSQGRGATSPAGGLGQLLRQLGPYSPVQVWSPLLPVRPLLPPHHAGAPAALTLTR